MGEELRLSAAVCELPHCEIEETSEAGASGSETLAWAASSRMLSTRVENQRRRDVLVR